MSFHHEVLFDALNSSSKKIILQKGDREEWSTLFHSHIETLKTALF